VIARDPFTPFAFLVPLYHLRLLLRLLLSPQLPLLLPGTADLVTPTATIWLNLVVVHIFLALVLLMSISAMRASWVAMFAFLFLVLLRLRRTPLILFTVTCGLLLFPVCLALSTTW
jgi:hypothetical protein